MNKRYRTILADPPWAMKMLGSQLAAKRKLRPVNLCYPTMPIDRIKAMPVADLAEDGAHLWLWAVNQMLREAFDVMEAWGFTYHNIITWRRPSGTGNYFVTLTQHLLFGYRKKCVFNKARYLPNAYEWLDNEPVSLDQTWPMPRVHSRKPEASYRLIESVSDEPRLELFARPVTPMFPKAPGWDVFGNEVESDLELTA